MIMLLTIFVNWDLPSRGTLLMPDNSDNEFDVHL